MKKETLTTLCCPFCQTTLSLNIEQESKIIESGELTCAGCERTFPIREGIVHFIAPQELEGSNRRFAGFYNRLAPLYSLSMKAVFLPFGGERKARMEILEHLELKGGRILEVSIGSGDNLSYLFELAGEGEIYGIDISIGQLSRCRSLCMRRGWQVELFLATAEQLPFKTDTFDSVLHIGGINFFSNKQKAIEEMIRVARPGNKIVIADEAERFAKRLDPSLAASSPGKGSDEIETTLSDLVPDTMEEVRMDGIWRMHGKYHGYCLEFRKPA